MEFNKDTIKLLKEQFDSIINVKEDVEFWYARDLQKILGYTEWRNFEDVMSKAMISCEKAGFKAIDHFVKLNKMVEVGSGAERQVEDYMLTRYACYLTAQNGDSKKPAIAFVQIWVAHRATLTVKHCSYFSFDNNFPFL